MSSRQTSALRRVSTLATSTAALLGISYLVREGTGVRTSMGASRGDLAASNSRSPHFDGKAFQNVLPSTTLAPGSAGGLLKGLLTRGSIGKPGTPVPLQTPVWPAQAAELAVTWLGHASALIEIDGKRILADPVWAERVSPSTVVGPQRMHPVPVSLEALPTIDAIIISHDHYDHLDLKTVVALRDQHSAPFLVPIGVGAHLRGWGVPENRVIELDWDGYYQLGDLRVTCTQARHFSGRGLTRNDTLWSSWALIGPQHRVFFGGDTGYTPAFAETGEKYGPFDLTLLPIGAYNALWPDIHLNPEEAVQTHLDVLGDILLPIHWGTFDLALHAWSEPVIRLLAAADANDVSVMIPEPGQRLDLTDPVALEPWWKAV